jgi:GrpB-like predicted nucleotidyltransferase (UPF0157 family)
MTEPVLIAQYDPRWPAMFEAERSRILAACEGVADVVHHIGSTSVPGLAAKPVIDILIGVHDPALLDVSAEVPADPRIDEAIEPAGNKGHVRFVQAFVRLGYTYRGENTLPGRLYLKRAGWHLHVTQIGSPFWVTHLAFRDWLREHPDDARAYATLKRSLAQRHGSDRIGYTEAKADFIQGILRKATSGR